MNAEKIFGENVYVNLDEVIETVYQCRREEANDEWVKRWLEPLKSLPTIEVSEEDELKFYYVDSIDAYWIGQRLDNHYYAEWIDRLGFVWSKSRYLPWGEHVIAPDTLWKEHTYPSEPREIPFTEWIVGFMKKFTSEDAISKAYLEQKIENQTMSVEKDKEYWRGWNNALDKVIELIEGAPSVIPKPKEGEWMPRHHQGVDKLICECSNCHTLHVITNYCPNCGKKMKGRNDETI